ncbi:GntR family transcriptional regulator [Haloferula sargassicola]|uniref:HTH-type transcriptional repressor NagR n=1 Tax=Haloferula sargassicola TaxID=490096 RepID=A0ABP9UU32_9BACT
MKIDHGSPVPLHAQVETLLREMLKQPKYREGALLPPEARIAEQLEVSRNTVRAAISRMVQEGVLERKAGHGTRYVNQPLRTSLKSWPSFSREMKQKGIEVVVFSLTAEFLPAPDEVARVLRLTKTQREGRVLKMERVRGYDDVPAVYSISWFHPRTGLQAADDFSKPLYQLVHAQSGLAADSSEEEISAALADKALAGKLACDPGSAVLVRRRIVRDPARKEIEYNLNFYRADRFSYGLTLQK